MLLHPFLAFENGLYIRIYMSVNSGSWSFGGRFYLRMGPGKKGLISTNSGKWDFVVGRGKNRGATASSLPLIPGLREF